MSKINHSVTGAGLIVLLVQAERLRIGRQLDGAYAFAGGAEHMKQQREKHGAGDHEGQQQNDVVEKIVQNEDRFNEEVAGGYGETAFWRTTARIAAMKPIWTFTHFDTCWVAGKENVQ